MKNLYPKKKTTISPRGSRALLVGSFVLAAFVIGIFQAEWALAAAFLLIMVGVVQWVIFNRCPHCGRHLGRDVGDFCQYCGERLDQSAPEPKTTQTERAYAKLNLTLDILGKRSDGYHEMQMVMQTISLHDDVTVSLSEDSGISCRVEGAELPCDEKNLAVKAARAFCAALDFAPDGVKIVLQKRIPSEAGMAGGSADAAAVLRALRDLCAPEVTDKTLEEIGAQIGSDVPFCVRGGTQLAEGRGELLTALKRAPHLYAAVCKPDFPISTPALFARADGVDIKDRPDYHAMVRAVGSGDAAELCMQVGNVFEQVLEEKQAARIAEVKRALLAHGAETAAMTGSGSAVFGLFREEAACAAACAALEGDTLQTFRTEFV